MPSQLDAERIKVGNLLQIRRYSDAARLLAPLLASTPDDAELWCLQAQTMLGLKELGGALRAAERAQGLAPDLEWAHRLASIVYSRIGDDGAGLHWARRAAACDPHSWRAQIRLAEALIRMDDVPRAEECARKAITLAPEAADTYFTLGRVLLHAKKRRQARRAFHTALALDPNHAAAHNERARSRLAPLVALRPSALGDASRGFTASVRADPTNSVARENLHRTLGLALRTLSGLVLAAGSLALSISPAPSIAARAFALVFFVLPVGYALRFVNRVGSGPARLLATLPRRQERAALSALCLQLLSILGVVVAALGPRSAWSASASLGVLLAIAAYALTLTVIPSFRRTKVLLVMWRRLRILIAIYAVLALIGSVLH